MKKILLAILLMVFLVGCGNRFVCDGVAKANPELGYFKAYTSNISSHYNCEIRNITKMQLDKEAAEIKAENMRQLRLEWIECYDKGESHNYTFDLKEHYGYSCEQLEYINNHFILGAEQKDGGNLEGSFSDFLSSGHIKGEFFDWVNVENLATGQLIKEVSYQINCDNITLHPVDKFLGGKEISYYNEADFVMYYTENCLK